jgi:hypothetical protein
MHSVSIANAPALVAREASQEGRLGTSPRKNSVAPAGGKRCGHDWCVGDFCSIGGPGEGIEPSWKGTRHHLERNRVIVRGHGFNSSAAPPGDVGRHDGWAADGALGCPMWIAGLGPGIGARGQQGVVVALAHLGVATQGQVARVSRDQ